MKIKIRIAEKFASIINGKVVLVTDTYPAHTLLPNQIPLTLDEFFMLKSVIKSDDVIRTLEKTLVGLKKKIKAVKK